MMALDWKRFAATSFVGSVTLIAFLHFNDIRDYAVAISWAGFIIASYFYHRLEYLLFKIVSIQMIEGKLLRERIDQIEK